MIANAFFYGVMGFFAVQYSCSYKDELAYEKANQGPDAVKNKEAINFQENYKKKGYKEKMIDAQRELLDDGIRDAYNAANKKGKKAGGAKKSTTPGQGKKTATKK